MKYPDLEVVEVQHDASFKVWSHGYPYRTVRWHFHPEYEIHLIVATRGKFFVGDHVGAFEPGNLVLMAPNLPHNWVSEVAPGETIAQRNLVVQFGQAFVANCAASFPEWADVAPLLDDARRGVLFGRATSDAVRPLFLAMLDARGLARITLFLSILGLLVDSRERTLLASPAYQFDATSFSSTRINHVLSYIGENLASELREADLAALAGQSASAFSRYFRRHTGLPFIQYVNRMRVNLACQLLRSGDASVTDICFQAGFNNLSNFNRQFLSIQRMTPTEFRQCQRLNDASRLASETAAANGEGIAGAPPIVAVDHPPASPPGAFASC